MRDFLYDEVKKSIKNEYEKNYDQILRHNFRLYVDVIEEKLNIAIQLLELRRNRKNMDKVVFIAKYLTLYKKFLRFVKGYNGLDYIMKKYPLKIDRNTYVEIIDEFIYFKTLLSPQLPSIYNGYEYKFHRLTEKNINEHERQINEFVKELKIKFPKMK